VADTDAARAINDLLAAAAAGDTGAIDRLMPLVYDELRQLARRHRRRFQDPRAPSTRSLVHETYLRLSDQTGVRWESRAQFFFLASRAMRSILIDNARHYLRQKRDGSRERVPLDDELLVSEARPEEMIALDDAISTLAAADPQLGQIVECRFYGGLTIEETAEALGVSPATVKRGWVAARARLFRALSPESTAAPPARDGD
jgi:RNA polymerase sigma factor (TIGR02999 family)